MIFGLNAGHDSGLAYISENKIYNFEFERSIGIKNVCGGNPNSFNVYLEKMKNFNCNYLGICDYFAGKCNWLPKEMYSISLSATIPFKEINVPAEEKEKFLLKRNTKVFAIKHHFSHAASTFFTSQFNKALIFTIDGASKDSESFVVSFGEENSIKILENYNNILGPRFGGLYEKFSKKIFKDKFSAGKLMGLSAYGRELPELKPLLKLMLIPNFFRKKIYNQSIILNEEIILKINDTYFNFIPEVGHHLDLTKLSIHMAEKSIFDDVFDEVKIGNKVFKFDYDYQNQMTRDLVFTIQQVFQEELINIIDFFVNKYNCSTLCFAGGSFLNIISNSIIKQKYKNIHIPPFCNDSGISIGNALVIKHNILNFPRTEYIDLPFGGEFIYQGQVKNLNIIPLSENDFYLLALEKLTQGKVIGWVHSRYELGPRALGNRSILASPLISGMKDFINNEIKFRESFRPLAPIMIEEELYTYFNNDPNKSPYMLFNYNINDKYQILLKELLHVDKTARVQTVNKKENSPIYNLLLKFQEKTTIPILFNTSLNIKGKPILNSYQEIYNMLKNTKLDSVFIVDNLSYISLKEF